MHLLETAHGPYLSTETTQMRAAPVAAAAVYNFDHFGFLASLVIVQTYIYTYMYAALRLPNRPALRLYGGRENHRTWDHLSSAHASGLALKHGCAASSPA